MKVLNCFQHLQQKKYLFHVGHYFGEVFYFYCYFFFTFTLLLYLTKTKLHNTIPMQFRDKTPLIWIPLHHSYAKIKVKDSLTELLQKRQYIQPFDNWHGDVTLTTNKLHLSREPSLVSNYWKMKTTITSTFVLSKMKLFYVINLYKIRMILVKDERNEYRQHFPLKITSMHITRHYIIRFMLL